MYKAEIIVGTMRLGVWGANFTSKQYEAFIDQCLEQELYHFDHADIYGGYTTEEEFGTVLKRRPDLAQRVRITTKCGIKSVAENRPSHAVKSYDSSAAHIVQSVENSLRMLGVDRIDTLLLHRPDFLMEPAEIAQVVAKLQSEGKIVGFGVSNFTPQQVEALHAHIPIQSHQIECSLAQTSALHSGILEQCMSKKIAPTAWSPLGGGSLLKPESAAGQRLAPVLQQLGEKYSCSADVLLLAWVLRHPSKISPVLGTSKIERVVTAKKALEIELSREDWYLLLQISSGQDIP